MVRLASICNHLMRRVLRAGVCAALFAVGASALAADQTAPAPALVGTPQVVKDLHWGDVLFYFYQGE